MTFLGFEFHARSIGMSEMGMIKGGLRVDVDARPIISFVRLVGVTCAVDTRSGCFPG